MATDVVRSEAYERIVEISVGTSHATAFTLNRGDTQYLVTARHVFPSAVVQPRVALLNRHIKEALGRPYEVELDLLSIAPAEADVAVARLPEPITANTGLEATSDGLMLSQPVFFLGFPFGLATIAAGGAQRIPFVKRAIVSAGDLVTDVKLWYLDGLNNPGFSGGPVVALTRGSDKMRVIGVVSGYRYEDQPVYVGTVPVEDESYVRANTGIIVATDISHVADAIDADAG